MFGILCLLQSNIKSYLECILDGNYTSIAHANDNLYEIYKAKSIDSQDQLQRIYIDQQMFADKTVQFFSLNNQMFAFFFDALL